jgi:glycosyltransferase involved in cell wall biosynthesis
LDPIRWLAEILAIDIENTTRKYRCEKIQQICVTSTYRYPKRLLFVSPHFPFPPTEGGMIRTYSLVRALQRNYDVHFLALQNSGPPSSEIHMDQPYSTTSDLSIESCNELGKIREKLRSFPGLRPLFSVRNKLKTVGSLRAIFWLLNLPFLLYTFQRSRTVIGNKLDAQPFDALLLDYTKMAHYLSLGKDGHVKKILNVHNVESDNARQMMLNGTGAVTKVIYWLQWRAYEFYERLYVPKCDLLLAASRADAETYGRLAPGVKTVVIPNAVDTEALKPLPPPEEPHSLIFPGRMDYPPNFQAVHIFCQEILPRVAVTFPSVRFYIVGKNPPESVRELASDHVVVTGFVEDVIPFWRKTAALVVPLSIGGGTRIKILEAMALGRPVISTSKGCEGLEVIHEKHLLIADDPERFAEHVIRVLKNPEEYFEMSRAARKLVEEKYSFAAIGDLLLRTLEDTLSEP